MKSMCIIYWNIISEMRCIKAELQINFPEYETHRRNS